MSFDFLAPLTHNFVEKRLSLTGYHLDQLS
jgi:hypothetical protein